MRFTALASASSFMKLDRHGIRKDISGVLGSSSLLRVAAATELLDFNFVLINGNTVDPLPM